MSQLQRAEVSGWAEEPKCAYLVVGNDGKLHCSYNYSKELKKAQETLPLNLVRDIGMDEGVNAAYFEGKIRERCSPEQCPNPAD